MAAIFDTPAPLYEALLRRDHTRLQSLLFGATPEDLDLGPVSLWHAAALAGDAAAVRQLAAAGAPVAAADQLVDVRAGRFGSLLSPDQSMAAGPHGTPLSAVGLAACGRHADVVAALLAAGASPYEGSDSLLRDAALTDCPAMLEQLVVAAPSLILSQQLGQELLCDAARHGCLRLLQHVADAAAGRGLAAECPSAAAWLAPAFHTLRSREGALPWGSCLMCAAALGDQAAAVRLLMSAGFPVTCSALTAAMRGFSHAALEVLLTGQVPEPPARLERSYGLPRLPLPSVEAEEPYCLCPIAEAFFLRVAVTGYGSSDVPFRLLGLNDHRARSFRGYPQAAHPLDVILLPMLERLLAAGYQRLVYSNVWVAHWAVGEHGPFAQLAPATLLQRFDPIRHVQVFDLLGRNGWLHLALQHPAWTPQQHRRFMPAFRKAAATLLLAARRGARQASGSSDGDSQPPAAMLGALPHELLLHITGLAAYPLSAWAPLDLASQCPEYRPPARPA